MNMKNYFYVSILLAAAVIPLAEAHAEGPVVDNTISEETTTVVPAPQPTAVPKKPIIKVNNVTGLVGATEQGVAGGASIKLDLPKDSWAQIDGVMGAPLLRIRGTTEVIPLTIYKKAIIKENGEVTFEISFIPSAEGQLTIAKGKIPPQSFIMINPALAAQIEGSYGPLYGKIRLRAAPMAGAGAVGDSKAWIYGARLGVDASIGVDITDSLHADASVSLDKFLTPAGVPGGYEVGGKATLGYDLKSGQTLYLGAAASATKLDIANPAGPSGPGNTSNFFGGVAGIAF